MFYLLKNVSMHRNYSYLYNIFCISLFILCSACAKNDKNTEIVPSEPTFQENFPGTVQDLMQLPQDLSVYLTDTRNVEIKTSEESAALLSVYKKRFFSPWHRRATYLSLPLKEFRSYVNLSASKRGYAENLCPWSDKEWADLRENADLNHVSPLNLSAVLTKNDNLRYIPTKKPKFSRIYGAGRGYPFDNFQVTALHIGTPIKIQHASKDGAWFFVESPYAWGWVDAASVALVDDSFIKAWEQFGLYCIIEDNCPLNIGGVFQERGFIGTVLTGTNSDTLMIPFRGVNGYAEIRTIDSISNSVTEMPLPMTETNIASIGNKMMGLNYGWGGLYEDRDCSSTLLDLFSPFGVWLPRNSASQSKAWKNISIAGLDSQSKKARILAEGKPFQTLVWMKGHILLYVGAYQNEPVFFHNIWGVRLVYPNGREGRLIIGKACITTAEPGIERSDLGQTLIERMEKLTFVGENKKR